MFRHGCFIALLAIAMIAITTASPALAADLDNGAKVFKANCSACHLNGRNVVVAHKTLRKKTLKQYGMYSTEAIQRQVTNGKNAMPAFGGRLSTQDIADVAAYVLDQAAHDWDG